MIYVKIHNGPTRVIAICDENLIGKTFKDNNLVLKIDEWFYKGDKKKKEEVAKIMKEAENLNIVGKESIEIALEIHIIEKDSILVIKGVPHAQVVSS